MTIQKLINRIRHFTTESVVYGGAKYLWDLNKGELKLDERSQKLLECYGYRVIILGLLETSDSILLTPNKKGVFSLKTFIELCENYLEALSYSQYGWNQNPKLFIDALKIDESQKPNKRIPEQYLQEEMCNVITNASKFNALMQIQNSQISKQQLLRITQTYMAVIMKLEKQNEKDIDITSKIKNTEPTQFLLSGWVLCSIAAQYAGVTDFANIPEDFKFKNDCNKDSCLKVAHKISKKVNHLKEEWKQLNSGLITQNTDKDLISFLQKIPPVICIKEADDSTQDVFLIPCRTAYLESLGSYLLSELSSSNKMKQKIGDAIEGHIQEVLENIFGVNNIEKIPTKDNQQNAADFYIKLDNADIIIELKRSCGYTTSIKDTASTWHRLHGAYVQCANSVKKYKTEGKPIISIIIIFEEIGLTPASFHVFAEQSGIVRDLGLEYIKIISWYDFESVLSKTSVSQFIATLLKNKNRYEDQNTRITLSDELYFPVFPDDTPAHQYEYLQDDSNKLQIPTA